MKYLGISFIFSLCYRGMTIYSIMAVTHISQDYIIGSQLPFNNFLKGYRIHATFRVFFRLSLSFRGGVYMYNYYSDPLSIKNTFSKQLFVKLKICSYCTKGKKCILKKHLSCNNTKLFSTL